MPLGFKYTIVKKFDKRLIKFKNVKPTKLETQLKKNRIVKDVEEIYRTYYDSCKGEYDISNELNETENKKLDHKQFFEIVVDKESKLDGETKNFIKEIKEREKGVDKKGFRKYSGYEPSALN